MPEREYRILAINPGLTSTKIGVFDNGISIFEKTLHHEAQLLHSFPKIIDQDDFRKSSILETLDKEGINISKFSAICGRGGLLRPIKGGTYAVNEAMLKDLRMGYSGQHPSNLGGILAYEIASGLNIPSFIVDPVVVDELEPIARISGFPLIERKSIFHALNQKAVARRTAKELGRPYNKLNLIIAHMGDGITVGAHKEGRVIDVNNGLNGDGPFSPGRAGTVPAGDLISLCYSGDYTLEESMEMLVEKGGLAGYLGTNNALQAEKLLAAGNQKAALVYEAMAYQIAKEIGAASAVLAGQVDMIILTGNLAYSDFLVKSIIERIHWIADVTIHQGEDVLQALAEGALSVLLGEEDIMEYPGQFKIVKI